MSAVVLAIYPTEAQAEAAWEQYRVLAAPLVDNPRLALDRAHMTALVRAEAKWKRTALAWDAGLRAGGRA